MEPPSRVERTQYNATVIGREEINPQLLILRVRSDLPAFGFLPGQFAVLGMLGHEPRVPDSLPEDPPSPPDKLIRRAYSIASSSLEQQYVEFYITLVTSGALTPRLFGLGHGSRVFLGPKASGLFTLDRASPDKGVVLVATGTGLAPYMSMLRTLLIAETRRRFVVVHGARHSWDLGYRAELETLARLRPNLSYIPSITRPEEDPHFKGVTGRIQTLIESGEIERLAGIRMEPSAFEVFLCGNPDMIQAVETGLAQRGFQRHQAKSPGTLHIEEYW